MGAVCGREKGRVTDRLTKEQEDAIRAAEKAATPGDWVRPVASVRGRRQGHEPRTADDLRQGAPLLQLPDPRVDRFGEEGRLTMRDLPFGFWVAIIAVLAIVAGLYLRAAQQCEECPAGSVGVVVRGAWGPTCICSGQEAK